LAEEVVVTLFVTKVVLDVDITSNEEFGKQMPIGFSSDVFDDAFELFDVVDEELIGISSIITSVKKNAISNHLLAIHLFVSIQTLILNICLCVDCYYYV
jgi:hypothetical protein